MKHFNLISLLLALIVAMLPQLASAHDFEVDGIYYLIDGNNATVTFRGTSDTQYSNEYTGEVNIPSTVTFNGTTYSVTSIGDYAFYKCTGLTSVTIPNSVTSIGKEAFYGCSGLTSVTIGNSVTSIGIDAFNGCSGLTKVNISDIAAWCNIDFMNYRSNPLTFAHNLYLNDNKLTNLLIPSAVTTIKQLAFNCCTSLTSVTIPNSVTSIGKEAFYGCTGLTSVTIPNSVTTIGSSAFSGCSGLTSVTIPNSVTSIGSSAFSGCSGLTSVTIGNSVTSIGNRAFNWCTSLTSVTIPNSVTTIGYEAFRGCSGLTSMTIPNSVTTIGDGVFWNCTGLTSVTIGNSVTSIGKEAFYGCSGLTSVTIGNSVTSIGNWAFNGCTGLTSVTIPNSVTTIGSSAFSGCSGLTSVTIGNSVTSIGNWAFNGCTGLTSVTIGNSVTSIGEYAFEYCTGLTSVTIPNSVTSIGQRAFYGCTGLTNIFSRILHPENVTLGNDVFDGIDKSNCILTIPDGSLSLYQNANQWKDFLNMVFYIGLSVAPDVAHVRGAEHRVHELSIDMSNDEAISGVQFLMTLPSGVSLATDSYGYYDVWLDDARRARNHSVSVEPRSGNKYFVLISSPTNKTFSGNTGDILHMNIEVDQYHSATGDYPVTISDIILAEADETEHNVSAAQSTVRMSYLVGDANADVEVDVGDYVVTANYILGHDTGIHFFSDAANANYTNNTAINVTDLVAITNIALELRDKEIKPDVSGFQRAPALTMLGTDYYLSADVIETGLDKTVIAVAVDNDEPIAAMQLDIDLPDGVTLESASVADRASGMNASCGISTEGKARVMLSSFGTNEISAGSGDVIMLTLRGKAQSGDMLQFSNVVMSERNLIEHGAVGDLMLDLNDITGLNAVAYENVNIYGSNGAVIIESPVEGMAQLVRINGMSQNVEVKPGRNVYPVNVSHGDIIIATFNGTTEKIQF